LFFFSSRRRHTRFSRDWSSDVCSSDLRALDAGCEAVMPLEDMFWGDRYGVLSDPFGHRWSIATHVRDVSPAELEQAMQQFSQHKIGRASCRERVYRLAVAASVTQQRER